jgi:hypothetical protein
MAAPSSSAPDITLQYPYVLLIQGASPLDGLPQGSSVLFGQLAMVNDLCDTFLADDYVLYINTGSVNVSYNGIDYVLVDQNNLLYREDYITPP